MPVTALKRWHWVAIALMVGLAHGWLRESAGTDADQRQLDDYDVLLTDPRQFEQALVGRAQGYRLFKDVVVYPYRLSGGRSVHLVTGRYWDGKTELRDGQYQARWVPACFVAPRPYQPQGAAPGKAPETYATVMEYLDALKDPAGVRYRYAWWWWATRPTFVSSCVSLLLVGVVWPTLVNLLASGTFTRPREAKGVSLWNVRTGRTGSSRPAVPGADPDALRRLEAELERHLAGDSAAPVTSPADERRPPAPTTTAAQPLARNDPRDPPPDAAVRGADKEFGAARDDFYPTELHVPPPRPGHAS